MLKLNINELAIEVTRKCNLKCAHCFRGDSQNVDLDIDSIEKLFHNDEYEINYIRSILITGGEPTLHPKAILKIIKELIDHRVRFDYFTIVTNGSDYNNILMKSIDILYKYWNICKTNNIDSDFVIVCSLDQFHQEPSLKVMEKYYKLPYFVGNKINISNNNITKMGRAYKNGLGTSISYYDSKVKFQEFLTNNEIEFIKIDDYVYLNELYLSAKGKYGYHIFDFTYDMVDQLTTSEKVLNNKKIK